VIVSQLKFAQSPLTKSGKNKEKETLQILSFPRKVNQLFAIGVRLHGLCERKASEKSIVNVSSIGNSNAPAQ
jgi:hypothetical protein